MLPMDRKSLTLIVLLSSLWTVPASRSQVAPFRSYTIGDGLLSNQVLALFQDSRGFLWIGTNNGLNVYDGATFTKYTTNEGLSNNWVTSIAESRTVPGRMLIGTIAGGLNIFDAGTWTSLPIDTSQGSDGYVGGVVADYAGNVWCNSRFGVFVIRDSVVTRLPVTAPREHGVDIALTPDSLILVATRRSLAKYHTGTTTAEAIPVPLGEGAVISAMTVTADGRVWIGCSDSSLVVLKDARVVARAPFRFGVPAQILGDGDHVWVRTSNCIVKVNEQDPRVQRLVPYRVATPQHITGVLVDHEGSLWIGTWSYGLDRLFDDRYVSIPLRMPDEGTGMARCSSDSAGHIWNGGRGGIREFLCGTDETWGEMFHPISGKTLYQPLLVDASQRLWISTEGENALLCFQIEHHQHSPSILRQLFTLRRQVHYDTGGIVTLYVDRHDHLWIATAPTGVTVVDVQSRLVLYRYSPTPELPFDHLPAIYHDDKDRIWVGTFTRGLYVIREGSQVYEQHFDRTNGLPGDQVRSILQDRNGHMWIGTRHNGVVRLDSTGSRVLSMHDGLASNCAWAMQEDFAGRIWMRTEVGLECVDATRVVPLPPEQGLVRGGASAFGFYQNRFLWAKAGSALTVMEFSRDTPAGVPPPVHIQRFEVSGVPVSTRTALEFPYHRNTFSIEYVGLSFRSEQAVRYRYRMLGIDTSWSASTPQRRVTFASLAPGRYTFEVVAVNGEGIRSVRPAFVDFVIVPPLWARWWFMAAGVVCVLGMLYTLYRYRLTRILEMERLRMRIASDLHDDVGTNLSSIIVASQIMQRRSGLTDDQRSHLDELRSTATRTQEMLRDIVWLLSPRNDSFDDFVLKLREIAGRLLPETPCTFDVSGGEEWERLGLEFKRNVVLFLKEVLNNVARHASAGKVEVEMKLSGAMFSLRVRDNGRGFRTDTHPSGNGLLNLRQRALSLGGSVTINSAPGKGTDIGLFANITHMRSSKQRASSLR